LTVGPPPSERRSAEAGEDPDQRSDRADEAANGDAISPWGCEPPSEGGQDEAGCEIDRDGGWDGVGTWPQFEAPAGA
jgi:hypothetical protein